MKYPFRVWPDPILFEVSKPVVFPENRVEREKFIQELQCDLRGYIYLMKVFNGIGLSAIQLGDPRRIVCVHAPENGARMLVLINPMIKSSEGFYTFSEGCLSIPGYFKKTSTRYGTITVDYWNEEGEFIQGKQFTGIVSACIQHEIEHLDGKLFVEAVSTYERDKINRRLKKHKRATAKMDFDWESRYLLMRASSEAFFSFFEQLGEAPEENEQQIITK